MRLRDIRQENNRLRDLTTDQLVDELAKLKREAFNLRFQRATGQLETTSRIGEVRHSIARVQTLLSEKRNASASKAS